MHAFEPSRDNFAKLSYNTRHKRNITLYQTALSDNANVLTFYESKTGTGAGSLIPSRDEHREAYSVPTERLDEIFPNTRIDLVKIDVEGAEHLVLDGLERIAREHSPHLIVELYPTLFIKQGLPGHLILSKLDAMGYTVYILDDHSGKIVGPIAPDTFPSFVTNLTRKYVNLYARRL